MNKKNKKNLRRRINRTFRQSDSLIHGTFNKKQYSNITLKTSPIGYLQATIVLSPILVKAHAQK